MKHNVYHAARSVRTLYGVRAAHLLSMPMGVKSSLCLVWKISVLVRISRMAGGCICVAMQNRASCGGTEAPSSDTRFCPWMNFRRPRKFRAWRREKKTLSDL